MSLRKLLFTGLPVNSNFLTKPSQTGIITKSTTLETYRSGHNELDSKSSCRVTGTWVRIPSSPLKNPCKSRVFNFYNYFSEVQSDLIPFDTGSVGALVRMPSICVNKSSLITERIGSSIKSIPSRRAC